MAPLKYQPSPISWRFERAIVPLSDRKLAHPTIGSSDSPNALQWPASCTILDRVLRAAPHTNSLACTLQGSTSGDCLSPCVDLSRGPNQATEKNTVWIPRDRISILEYHMYKRNQWQSLYHCSCEGFDWRVTCSFVINRFWHYEHSNYKRLARRESAHERGIDTRRSVWLLS